MRVQRFVDLHILYLEHFVQQMKLRMASIWELSTRINWKIHKCVKIEQAPEQPMGQKINQKRNKKISCDK